MRPRWRRILVLVACLAVALAMMPYLRQPSPTASTTFTDPLADDDQARQACKKHRFPYFEDRHTRKIYDLFLVGTELDLLEIRLHTLDPVVDYFIIVESTQTFTRQPKPLHVSTNMSRFSHFGHKIILHTFDLTTLPPTADPWTLETHSRNALFTQIFPHLTGPIAPAINDVLLVSDIDEIPKPATLSILKSCHFPAHTTLESAFYYYSFQWRHLGKRWLHPQATVYSGPNDTLLPQTLRTGAAANKAAAAQYRVLYDAAWHCSSCFSTVAEVRAKLTGFSHQEFNHPLFLDGAQIVRRFRHGVDLAEREFEKYEKVDGNEDLPGYLVENKAKFPWLVDRDGPNAGFLDWEGGGAESLDEWKGPWPSVWPQ